MSSCPPSTSPQDASLSPLPQNWEKHRTQDGKDYYANRVTGESSWEKPKVQKLPPPPPPPPQPPLLQQQKQSAFSNDPVQPAKKQRQGTILSLLQINIMSKAGNPTRLLPPTKTNSFSSEVTCIGCNRSFKNTQGLGGHQVS